MLGAGRYLLGVVEIFLLVGFAWLGASMLRHRTLGDVDGAPAHLATAVIAVAILLVTGELLGTFGLFEPAPYIAAVVVVGLGVWVGLGRGWGFPTGAAASSF
jgi:fatty acid desaturase